MKIFVQNEYDPVKAYLMTYPCQFDAADNTSIHKGAIDKSKTIEQYNGFVNLLTQNGVEVYYLDIINSTEQVFTRDIGFVVNDIFFVSRLNTPERNRETVALMKFIRQHGFKYHVMQNPIEGGDVVHYQGVLFIGVGDRTNLAAVREVQAILEESRISATTVPLHFDTSMIHLDCTFNTLDEDSCVITDYVYDVEIIRRFFKNVIKLGKAEADELGANYVYLGQRKLITNSLGTMRILSDNGYNAIHTDFSEICKASGSLGCCTLPVYRSN